MPDEPEFPAGARTWEQIRRAAEWLSVRMRGEQAPGARVYGTPRTGEEATFTEHERQPTYQHGRGGIAFVGGALDKLAAQAVYNTYRKYIASGWPAAYFTESQGAALAKWLDDNAGRVTAVYGHSYGADTAAKVFEAGHGNGIPLHAVDPVSRRRPDFATVAQVAAPFYVYYSTSNATRNDRIANAGGRWGDAPARHARMIPSDRDHVDIWKDAADFLFVPVPAHRRRRPAPVLP